MCKMSCCTSVKTLARARAHARVSIHVHTRLAVHIHEHTYRVFRFARLTFIVSLVCAVFVCALACTCENLCLHLAKKEPSGYQDAVALRYDMLIKCVKMSGTLSLSL